MSASLLAGYGTLSGYLPAALGLVSQRGWTYRDPGPMSISTGPLERLCEPEVSLPPTGESDAVWSLAPCSARTDLTIPSGCCPRVPWSARGKQPWQEQEEDPTSNEWARDWRSACPQSPCSYHLPSQCCLFQTFDFLMPDFIILGHQIL